LEGDGLVWRSVEGLGGCGVRVVWFVIGGRQRVTWVDELMITVSRPVFMYVLCIVPFDVEER
jgi:hypothetical protein